MLRLRRFTVLHVGDGSCVVRPGKEEYKDFCDNDTTKELGNEDGDLCIWTPR